MHGLPDMDDSGGWYANNHPDPSVGSVIPYVCVDCAHEYAIGECAVCRDPDDATIYTISSLVRSANQPPTVIVNTPDGRSRHFAVTQIRPNREKESNTVQPSAKSIDGYF